MLRLAPAFRPFRIPQVARSSRFYATEAKATPSSRISTIESRLPRFLQRLVTPIRNAPISHVTAFLVLHEITAIVPLFGLAGAFHYFNWLPPYISEGKWVSKYTAKFGRYLRKRGWIKDESRSGQWFGKGEGSVRLVVELATAYAICKALLPLRLAVSVWCTPWFARWTVLPVTSFIRRRFSARTTATIGPAAGTGAVGAGVLPKEAKPK